MAEVKTGVRAARGRLASARALVTVLGAVALVTAPLLPWRSTAHGSDNGWRTAGLVLALGSALHKPALQALASTVIIFPLAGLVAASLTARPRSHAYVQLCRGFSALSLLSVLTLVYWLMRDPLVSLALAGPGTALLGGVTLFLLCCYRPTACRIATNIGDVDS